MTSDPENQPETPQSGAQRPSAEDSKPPKRRFNPFLYEEDMFKIVVWVGIGVVAVILLVVLAQLIF